LFGQTPSLRLGQRETCVSTVTWYLKTVGTAPEHRELTPTEPSRQFTTAAIENVVARSPEAEVDPRRPVLPVADDGRSATRPDAASSADTTI